MQGLVTNKVPANQEFCPLEKLSKSDKSYFIIRGKIYSKCRNLELTLPWTLCQFIGRFNKGDENDWYQQNSESLHIDFPKKKNERC